MCVCESDLSCCLASKPVQPKKAQVSIRPSITRSVGRTSRFQLLGAYRNHIPGTDVVLQVDSLTCLWIERQFELWKRWHWLAGEQLQRVIWIQCQTTQVSHLHHHPYSKVFWESLDNIKLDLSSSFYKAKVASLKQINTSCVHFRNVTADWAEILQTHFRLCPEINFVKNGECALGKGAGSFRFKPTRKV